MIATTRSPDGVAVRYEVEGDGEIALVFVHGWCCHRNHWRGAMERFASQHTVVALDLAGHGESGRGRARWSIEAFGQDVAAVVTALGQERVVLVGHSMGGLVIVEAVCLLPAVVIGLIGVETWQEVGTVRTPEQVAQAVAPLRADFRATVRAVVPTWFGPSATPSLVEEITQGMAAASSDVGIGAAEATLGYAALPARRAETNVPWAAINASLLSEAQATAMRRHGIDVTLQDDVGHFVMQEDPAGFYRALDRAIRHVTSHLPN